tara:strand:- start:818 stop:1111 length:294 start_codon:yes stop_codon:yes gene_type:complete
MKHNYTVEELKRMLYEAREEEQLEEMRHIKNYNEAIKETPNSVERWNMYPPKEVAETMGIMHPQEITKNDWYGIWFDALGLWGACVALLIFLVIIDY